MGTGLNFTCGKCGHTYSVFLGSGMMFPEFYHNELEKVANGEFGTELKETYDNTPYAAISADKIVYICDSCSNWVVTVDHSLYAPNYPELIPKTQFGIKTVEEWGYVPYVDEWDLQRGYHLVKRHYRKCERCGKRMHKATDREARFLACPKCGHINEEDHSIILWD